MLARQLSQSQSLHRWTWRAALKVISPVLSTIMRLMDRLNPLKSTTPGPQEQMWVQCWIQNILNKNTKWYSSKFKVETQSPTSSRPLAMYQARSRCERPHVRQYWMAPVQMTKKREKFQQNKSKSTLAAIVKIRSCWYQIGLLWQKWWLLTQEDRVQLKMKKFISNHRPSIKTWRIPAIMEACLRTRMMLAALITSQMHLTKARFDRWARIKLTVKLETFQT